jgi:hypothetical protein
MKRMRPSTVLVLAAVLTAAGFGLFRAVLEAQGHRDTCDRACLNGHMDRYLTALIARDPSRVPTTSTVRFTENSKTLRLGEGAWKTATELGTFRIEFADVQEGQAGFIGVLQEGAKSTMLAVRLKVVSQRIAEVETILARVSLGGESDLAPGKLTTGRPAWERIVPVSERSPRREMITVANSYYEGIGVAKSDITKFADDCHRIENGVALVNNPNFDYGFTSPSGKKVPNFGAMGCREQFNTHIWETDVVDHRRYSVIDEERGLVWAFSSYHGHAKKKCADVVGFGPVCGGAAAAQSSTLDLVELFKIRNGLIHEMESVWTVLPAGVKPAW